MFKEDKQRPTPTRRLFLGCAAGALGVGAAPVREEPEVEIPLNTVVASSGQKGLVELPQAQVLGGDERKQKRFFSSPIGPSNLFLVFGEDLKAAIEATYSAFVDGRSVDRPVLRPGEPKGERDQLWAVVYFGSAQSRPTEWAVTRVAIQGDRVRVSVSRPDYKQAQFMVFDRRLYMIWTPLGKRKEEGLTLQVYDETSRAVVMSRRVTDTHC